jgi:hypothetical protein
VSATLGKENAMNENRTTITNVDIPFGRMVMIILKMMLAAIPAMLLFYLIMIPIMLLFSLGLGGCAALSSFCP